MMSLLMMYTRCNTDLRTIKGAGDVVSLIELVVCRILMSEVGSM